MLPAGNNWNSIVGNVEIGTIVCERFEIFVPSVTISARSISCNVHDRVNEMDFNVRNKSLLMEILKQYVRQIFLWELNRAVNLNFENEKLNAR